MDTKHCPLCGGEIELSTNSRGHVSAGCRDCSYSSKFCQSEEEARERLIKPFEQNTETMIVARLEFKILTEGAFIRSFIAKNGEEWWGIFADFSQKSRILIPKEYELTAIQKFKTEKGAIGWCKRKNIVLKNRINIDLAKIFVSLKDKNKKSRRCPDGKASNT